jgi:hypothetical protein
MVLPVPRISLPIKEMASGKPVIQLALLALDLAEMSVDGFKIDTRPALLIEPPEAS